MASYSTASTTRLAACHADVQIVFNEVVKYFDNSILVGHRGKADQNAAFDSGHSKLNWPKSKHNSIPSEAVDAAPYPIDWGDRERMTYFAGYVIATADRLLAEGKITHRIRWGGDWDRDTEVRDNKFNDFPHFEII